MSTRIISIDPGYGRCGIAVLERAGGKEKLLYSDCIETNPKAEFPTRLAEVVAACTQIMKEYAPTAVAMEKLFMGANRKTAMQVAEVRGALTQAATEARLPVFEYGPGEIKSAAAGWGGADKGEVARMLHLLIEIDKEIEHDDEYDAIAVGVTHFAHHR